MIAESLIDTKVNLDRDCFSRLDGDAAWKKRGNNRDEVALTALRLSRCLLDKTGGTGGKWRRMDTAGDLLYICTSLVSGEVSG